MDYGVSLGSNLGDRLRQLQQARQRILHLPGVGLLATSSVYETEPVGVGPAHQDKPFLNAILILSGMPEPQAMAAALHRIEDELGRVRSEDRNAPRPIDLDLIYAGTVALATDALTLPHPRWEQRRFVVQPLAEVRPALVLPGQSVAITGLLLALPPHPDVVLFTRDW